MKKILAFVLSLMLLVGCAISASAATYDLNTAKESVVRILVEYTIVDPNYPELYGLTGESLGSGFAIGKVDDEKISYVATAAHVIMHHHSSDDVSITTTEIEIGTGMYVYVQVHVDAIKVLVTDRSGFILAQEETFSPRADVAIIKLNSPIPRKAAIVYDRKSFGIGEQLTAMGFPSAAEDNLTSSSSDQLVATTNNVTTLTGSFSNWDGHANTHQGDQITTDTAMTNGISGGPLVDKDGYVVGVCVAGSIRSQNMNYAVAADELISEMKKVSELKVDLGPLGTPIWIYIAIAALVLLIALLVVLIIVSSKGKNNNRSLTLGGVMAGKVVPLKKGVPVVIGRDPNRCQIVYPKDAAGVSSVHCTITFDGTQVTVADNGSSYGTFVGGTKVEPGKPMVMHRGQQVTFGSEKNTADLH